MQVQTTPEMFSATLVDLTLPGMGGFELARRILESSPNARVIATSGYPMDLQSLEIAAPGRISFLQKPFRPEMLAAILQVSEPPATKGKV
jgi:CheY-like chemotaxis protein